MKKLSIATIFLLNSACLLAQESFKNVTSPYDPDRAKVIPDKIIEFGIPVLILFGVLNLIANILKNRAENNLKLKMIERGVSEDSMLKIFQESNAVAKLQPIKWFLFSVATGLSLIIIHLLTDYLTNQSGYLAIGIILMSNAIAFLIYYNILSRKV